MEYDKIMKELDKKLDVTTNTPAFKRKKVEYKRKIEHMFYSKIGKDYAKFCKSLNTRYGCKIDGTKFGIAGAKFSELFAQLETKIKSAVFVGELPGRAALACMFIFDADIIITSPLNSKNTLAKGSAVFDNSITIGENTDDLELNGLSIIDNDRTDLRIDNSITINENPIDLEIAQLENSYNYDNISAKYVQNVNESLARGYGVKKKTDAPKIKIKDSNSQAQVDDEPDLLDDIYGISKLPQWRSYKSSMIQDESFKNELKTNKELGKHWLISDIGFESNQDKQQEIVTASILDVLKNRKNGIGASGCIIKLYGFGHGKVLDDSCEISKMYNMICIYKPQGSPISNKEVYVIFKYGLAITDDRGFPLRAIANIRMMHIEDMVKYYDEYTETKSIPIKRNVVAETIKFIERARSGVFYEVDYR